MSGKPVIEKVGTIGCDLVETTPVVFHDRLYRFESVRRGQRSKHNPAGDASFRFIDVATGESTPEFAVGYHLGNAYVAGDMVYAYGVPNVGPEIGVFWSEDMENWSCQTALHMPEWRIYNTSVCRADGPYVMAFEVGRPEEVVGMSFTNFFAQSADLLHWEVLPLECIYSRERYTACPALRYLDGHFYMIYLEIVPREGQECCYVPHIVRSSDLIHWESSPYNPVLEFSDEDRRIANPNLTAEERQRIATACNRNNSDVDLCEFEGRVVIYYSWGNQKGIEHLAEAVYHGTLESLLRGFFPSNREVLG